MPVLAFPKLIYITFAKHWTDYKLPKVLTLITTRYQLLMTAPYSQLHAIAICLLITFFLNSRMKFWHILWHNTWPHEPDILNYSFRMMNPTACSGSWKLEVLLSFFSLYRHLFTWFSNVHCTNKREEKNCTCFIHSINIENQTTKLNCM